MQILYGLKAHPQSLEHENNNTQNFPKFLQVGGLLGPQVVRVSGTAETECASGKPSV